MAPIFKFRSDAHNYSLLPSLDLQFSGCSWKVMQCHAGLN